MVFQRSSIVFSDHQAAMVTLRHEYKAEVENIQVLYMYIAFRYHFKYGCVYFDVNLVFLSFYLAF